MTPLELLQVLTERRVMLFAKGETLLVWPASAITDLHDSIRAHKPELLRLARHFGGPILASGPLEVYTKSSASGGKQEGDKPSEVVTSRLWGD